MDENRLEGTARNLGGKIQEDVGRATGDTNTKAEGLMNQAAVIVLAIVMTLDYVNGWVR